MEALGKTSSEEEEEVNNGVHDDVEQEVLSTFKEKEDKKFRLFNHVIEQQNEIEMLESQVQLLHDEEQHYTYKVGAGREQNRQTMENLESRGKSIQVRSHQSDYSNIYNALLSSRFMKTAAAPTVVFSNLI